MNDVAKATKAGSGCEEALESNAQEIENVKKEIQTISTDTTLSDEAIESRINVLRDHISSIRAERARLVEALKTDAVGAFIDVWGTHYAHSVVFGQATYETRRFSRNELKKIHEWGLDVGNEAKVNIKGVDVTRDTNVSTKNREAFSEMVKDGRTRQTSVGGDGDDVEPIKDSLVPLSGLIQKRLFGAAWRPEFGDFARRLDLATQVLLEDPDLYVLLKSLEIWKVRFDSFRIVPAEKREFMHGGIKLNRSSHLLQDPQPDGLDAQQDPGKGHYLWGRANKPGEKVRADSNEKFIYSGRAEDACTVYLVARSHEDNPHVTLSAYVRNDRNDITFAQGSKKVYLTNLRAGALDNGELWVKKVLVALAAERVSFDDLPAYKRLEISRHLLAEKVV